jgi:MFS family permease
VLGLLRGNRTFRLLVLAKATSFAGDSVLLLALPYFLYESTRSVTTSAAVFLVAALPNAVLGPVLGSLADRLSPRPLLVGCDLISALASAALLLVTGGRHTWVVYVAAFVLVCSGQIVTFTRGTVTPRVVPPEQLLAANSLESALLSVVRLAAPALGGLLYAAVGLGWLVSFNALTFLLSAALLATLQLPAAPAAPQPGRGGPRTIGLLRPRGLPGRLAVLTGGYFLMSAASTVLLVPFVHDTLRSDAAGVGALSAAGAVGALVGAAVAVRAQRRLGTLTALGALLGIEGLGRMGVTLTTTVVSATLLVAVAGAGGSAFLTLLQTALQQSVPGTHVGRVLGLVWTLAGWCTIAGMLLFSGQAQSLPVQRVLQESALMCLLLAVSCTLLLRHQHDPIPAPVPEPTG